MAAVRSRGGLQAEIHDERLDGQAGLGVEVYLVVALVASTVAIVTFGHTVLFEVKDWLLGDLSYHRGVAMTMRGSTWQGEGPFLGLLSYFGGLYPWGMSMLHALTGVGFDALVSVVGWVGVFFIPAALFFLGRQIWDRRPLPIALFVFLAVVAFPLTTRRQSLWVESIVVSGHNFWPLFPRDIGLALLLVAAGFALMRRRSTRIVGSGLSLALAIATHAQLGAIACLLVAVLIFIEFRDHGLRLVLTDVGAIAGIALFGSAWWWVPRAGAALASSQLPLASHPLRLPYAPSLPELLRDFGFLSVMGLLGAVVLTVGRWTSTPLRVAIGFGVVALPLAAVARIGGDLGFVIEERAWLVASVALLILAAEAVIRIPALVRRPALGVFASTTLVLALVVSSIPGFAATINRIDSVWRRGHGYGQVFELETWEPLWEELASVVANEGAPIVLTYDAYAALTWSYSGARVHSAWLQGPMKLGFDLEAQTGRGYTARVIELEEAFAEGRPGVCALAEAVGSTLLLLDVDQGRLGAWDAWPAARHRVEPIDKNPSTLSVPVGDGLIYMDRNQFDYLILEEGASIDLFPNARFSALAIAFREPSTIGPTVFSVSAGGQSHDVVATSRAYHRVVVEFAPEVRGPVTITANSEFSLLRVTAFEPDAHFLPLASAPHLFPLGDVCSGASELADISGEAVRPEGHSS